MILNKSKFIMWLSFTIELMVCIFLGSNMPYQKQDIKPVLQKEFNLSKNSIPLIHFTYENNIVTSQNPYAFIEFFLRKLAHATEYGLLTILWINTFSFSRFRSKKMILSIILTFLYACSDEWHETFVPGRVGSLIDVFLPDSLGILLGLILFTRLSQINRERQLSHKIRLFLFK
jgi:VanZ family protein